MMGFISIVIFITFITVFSFIAKSLFSTHKKVNDTIKDATEVVTKQIHIRLSPPTEQETICEYCGSSNKVGDTKCSACGAKIKRNNKTENNL